MMQLDPVRAAHRIEIRAQVFCRQQAGTDARAGRQDGGRGNDAPRGFQRRHDLGVAMRQAKLALKAGDQLVERQDLRARLGVRQQDRRGRTGQHAAQVAQPAQQQPQHPPHLRHRRGRPHSHCLPRTG